MIESSEPVLTALRAADPAVSVTVDETIAFPALRRARAPLPKRRRRWGWGLVVAVALAAIAIPAGAVASSYVAHTGWFGSPNPGATEGTQRGSEADGSEWLEITAPDFVDAAAGLMPAYITLPTGYNPEHFAKAVATRIKQQIMNGPDRADTLKYGSLMQTTGFVWYLENQAQCEWRGEWLSAHDTGDTVRAERAAAVLTASATWPATVSSDGGGIVANEKRLAAAAVAGDRQTVAIDGMQNCTVLPAGAAQ